MDTTVEKMVLRMSQEDAGFKDEMLRLNDKRRDMLKGKTTDSQTGRLMADNMRHIYFIMRHAEVCSARLEFFQKL